MTKYNKIVKFIKAHRKENNASFSLLTTLNEIIITVEDKRRGVEVLKNREKNQLRLKYK